MDVSSTSSHQDHGYATPEGTVRKRLPKSHRNCCVPHCTSRGYFNDDERGKVFHFKFPKDPILQKQWIGKIFPGEDDTFQIKKHSTVCSLHFHPEEIEFQKYAGRNYLKPGAVPTVFRCWEKIGKSDLIKKNRECKPNKFQLRPATTASTASVDAFPRTGLIHDRTSADGDNLDEDTSISEEPVLQHQQNKQKIDSVDTLHKELHEKLCLLQNQVAAMKEELRLCEFTIDNIKSCDVIFFTGFPNIEVFNSVLKFLDPGLNGEKIIMANFEGPSASQSGSKRVRSRKLSPRDQFFLFLCRVRLGILELDLAYRFRLSVSTVSNIIITWANFVCSRLCSLDIWPTKEQVMKTMPKTFLEKYPNTRVIIDACEIKTEMPPSLAHKSQSYSSSNTLKGLIGISPAGDLSFVSQLYEGSISDKELIIRSGLLKMPFQVGDDLMADKGFDIQDLLDPIGVKLNIPPFLGRSAQMSASDEASTHDDLASPQCIAAERIHVERLIKKITNFHIFDRALPLSLAGTTNQIWTSCALLTLFQDPDISQPTLNESVNGDSV